MTLLCYGYPLSSVLWNNISWTNMQPYWCCVLPGGEELICEKSDIQVWLIQWITQKQDHTEQKIATVWSHRNSDLTDNALGIIFQYAHEMMDLQIVDFRTSWIEGEKAGNYAPHQIADRKKWFSHCPGSQLKINCWKLGLRSSSWIV